MSESEQSLLSLLEIAASIHHLNRRSEKSTGLSIVQWVVLKTLIDRPRASAQNLAKAVGVHPSTLTQTLKRLERKNYIYVTSDPKDSRKKLIALSREGRDILKKASQEVASWTRNFSVVGSDLSRVQYFLREQLGPMKTEEFLNV